MTRAFCKVFDYYVSDSCALCLTVALATLAHCFAFDCDVNSSPFLSGLIVTLENDNSAISLRITLQNSANWQIFLYSLWFFFPFLLTNLEHTSLTATFLITITTPRNMTFPRFI